MTLATPGATNSLTAKFWHMLRLLRSMAPSSLG